MTNIPIVSSIPNEFGEKDRACKVIVFDEGDEERIDSFSIVEDVDVLRKGKMKISFFFQIIVLTYFSSLKDVVLVDIKDENEH